MAVASPHISLAAEPIFHISGFSVTNSILTTWIVMAILFVLAMVATAQLKRKPGRGQVITELLVGGLFSFFTNLGGKHGKSIAPLAVTLFLYILVSNWIGLLPGVGTIGMFEEGKKHVSAFVQQVVAATEPAHEGDVIFTEEAPPPVGGDAVTEEHAAEAGTMEETAHETEAAAEEHVAFVPYFRGPTADLNMTIALGLIAMTAVQFFGLKHGGIKYLTKFVDLRSPIYLFVGLLELVSDVSKVASFAFRLFGNVFAGEVLLSVIAFLPLALIGVPPLFVTIPFYLLEIFVGVIQALVFAMLTTVFINMAIIHAEHAAHGEAHAEEH